MAFSTTRSQLKLREIIDPSSGLESSSFFTDDGKNEEVSLRVSDVTCSPTQTISIVVKPDDANIIPIEAKSGIEIPTISWLHATKKEREISDVLSFTHQTCFTRE